MPRYPPSLAFPVQLYNPRATLQLNVVSLPSIVASSSYPCVVLLQVGKHVSIESLWQITRFSFTDEGGGGLGCGAGHSHASFPQAGHFIWPGQSWGVAAFGLQKTGGVSVEAVNVLTATLNILTATG